MFQLKYRLLPIGSIAQMSHDYYFYWVTLWLHIIYRYTGTVMISTYICAQTHKIMYSDQDHFDFFFFVM